MAGFWSGFGETFSTLYKQRKEQDFQSREQDKDRTWREEQATKEREQRREDMIWEMGERRKDTLLSAGLSALTSGGGSGGGGGGSSDIRQGKADLEAIKVMYPETDNEVLTALIENPAAASAAYSAIETKRNEYSEAGMAFTQDMVNDFLVGVTTSGQVGQLSDEDVASYASLWGIGGDMLNTPVAEGAGYTWGDMARAAYQGKNPTESTLITDPLAAVAPMDPETAKQYMDVTERRVGGAVKADLAEKQRILSERGDELGAEEKAQLQTEIIQLGSIEKMIEKEDYVSALMAYPDIYEGLRVQYPRIAEVFPDVEEAIMNTPEPSTEMPEVTPPQTELPSFQTEDEVREMFNQGKIKPGDIVIINGQQVLIK